MNKQEKIQKPTPEQPEPNTEFAELSMAEGPEQRDFWQEVWDKALPERKEHVFPASGFFYFPLQEDRVDPRIVGSDDKDIKLIAEGLGLGSWLEQIAGKEGGEIPFEKIQRTLCKQGFYWANLEGEGNDKFKEAYKRLFGREYKMHLMPQREFLPFVISELLEKIKEDPEFSDNIIGMKVLIRNEEEREEVKREKGESWPVVVIYSQLGKEHAQKVLDGIRDLFDKHAKDIGLDDTPRHNRRVNELVYYAQGSGDDKKGYLYDLKNQIKYNKDFKGKSIEEVLREQKIFTPDLVHYEGEDNELEI